MLKTRIITALGLLTFFIPALFYLPNTLWVYLILFISLFAAYEWGQLSGLSEQSAKGFVIVYFLVSALALYLLHSNGFHTFFYISLNIFALATFFWLILAPIKIGMHYQVKLLSIRLLLGIFLILSFWMGLVCAKYVDPLLLLGIVSTIWIADSVAYFSGKKFGKHKLAKTISPGKTWEGVFGALLAVSLFAIILKLGLQLDTWLVLPGMCLIAIVGIYGDLLESIYKRQANMKDSGNLLPGHGGILDRVDGLIPALPVGMFFLYIYHYFVN